MHLKYSPKVLSHFLQPKNLGTIKNADGYGEVGSPICGDMLEFSIKVKNNVITDIKFQSFGCASNIATASALTERVKGMTLENAKKVTFNDIMEYLGGLPLQKIHCSVLAIGGLKKAIENYEKKNRQKKPTPRKKFA